MFEAFIPTYKPTYKPTPSLQLQQKIRMGGHIPHP
jgi:hypothetical protein